MVSSGVYVGCGVVGSVRLLFIVVSYICVLCVVNFFIMVWVLVLVLLGCVKVSIGKFGLISVIGLCLILAEL